jgi:hypothetical protein
LILFHRSSQSSQSSQMLALDCRSKSQIKHACPTARDRPRNSRAAASCRRPRIVDQSDLLRYGAIGLSNF